ncbi:hypothetical protein OG785_45285 [Streptomyces sp. NBC_00006]|uniref:hypothetical protein n=1 Tax=Streptomyces sp. NBC_00006 TaxID=2975619 RepID=UPI0022513AA5|nr:hypothetical protein [Streptomyces sp. NBC_00006]MCX5528994.1 hypothetical protein [Streptomyces sp. NBC_00006]MCX5537774.1 hypothetical protein [Streptomyces sp. NBC_00006]
MSDFEPEIDDIRAMRQENGGADLKAFLRQQIANGRAQREQPARKPVLKPPGHRPGAWPPGCSPPGPPPERQIPAPAWQAAARHASNEINRPDQPCDCGNCPVADTEENR